MAQRAPKKQRGGLGDMVVGAAPLTQQFTRIGGSMTPRMVSSILREAHTGRPARFVDLTYECRAKHNHLHAALQLMELSVAGLRYDCASPEGAKAKTKRAAKVFKEAMVRARGFREALKHLVCAGELFVNGWVEVVWRREGRYIVPASFHPVPARRFLYRQSDGKVLYDPVGAQSEALGIDLYEEYGPGKFISWRPNAIGDVDVRGGLAQPLVWASLFCNWGVTDWLSLAELSWKPWRKGIYKKTGETKASAEDISKLRAVCEAMASSGVAVHPDTVELLVEWPKQNVGTSGKTPHQMLVEFFNDEISKSTVGQTDLLQPGANGSRAATETRSENTYLKLRDARAEGVQAAIQQCLVEPFCQMNFGDIQPFDFWFITKDSADIQKLASAVASLSGKNGPGLRLSAAWVRDEIGAPEPKKGEETIGGPPPPEDGDGEKPRSDPGEDGSSDEQDDDSADEDEAAEGE